jgi:hypothetical protein
MRTKLIWPFCVVAALGLGWYLGATFGLPGPFIGSPEAAAQELRSVLRDPDPLRRASRMERLFARLDVENLPGAIEVYREEALRGEMLGAMRFMGRWSELDREGLVEALGGWPHEQSQAQGFGWAVYRVALDEGVPAAVRFYGKIPPKLSFTARHWLVDGAVEAGDLSALHEWAASQSEVEERRRLAGTIVTRLLRDGTEVATGWFESIPENAENHFKQLAFGLLLERLVRLDPAFALNYWETRADRPWAQRTAIPMGVAWVDDDPDAAIAWVMSQPAGDERNRLLYAVVERWSLSDDRAAVRWLEALPPSPELDGMYGRFARSFTIKNPELAATLLSRISESEARVEALTPFARYWFRRRPDELRAWLAASGVPSAETEGVVAALEAKRSRLLESKKSAPADG